MNIVVLITVILAYMLMDGKTGKVGDIYVEITTTKKTYRGLFSVVFEKKRSGYQLRLERVRDNGEPIYFVENENFSKYDDVKSVFFISGDDPIIDYKTHVVTGQDTSPSYYDKRYHNFDRVETTPTLEEKVYYYVVDELDMYRSNFSYYTMDKDLGLLVAANKTGYIANIGGVFTVVTSEGNFTITDNLAFLSGSQYVTLLSEIYRLKRSTTSPLSGAVTLPI